MIHPLGIIFDMDGVLVDSYQAHWKSWQQMTGERGLCMTSRQFDATFGRTSREIIAALWPQPPLSDSEIRGMDARKEVLYRQILAQQFPAMPGASHLIHRLHEAGMAVALGSSGPPENAGLVLEQLRAQSLFAAAVTGDDVRRGKPDPEVFLLAAFRLGIPPQHCCVVEDAPLGIVAAQRAGMATVGIASTGRTRQMLSAADLVIDSLRELSPAVVQRLIRRRLEINQLLASVPC